MSQVDRVFNSLLEKIENGTYQLNDKLPSQNKLSKYYGVSRTTVREALSSLESLNYIETKKGQGSFVINTTVSSLFNESIYETFDEKQLFNLLEFRTIIEVQAAAISATRRDDNDLKNIKDALKHFEKITINDEIGVEADYAFHEAILISTKNDYLIQTFKNFRDIHLKALNYSLKMNLNKPRKRQSVYNEHRLIYDAILSMDSIKARDSMYHHLINMRRKLGDPRIE